MAVCMKAGDCLLLLLLVSGIGVKGNVAAATGERDGVEAGPDGLATVQHDTGVLGAETVGCRCVARIEGFLCDSLRKI